MQPYPINIPISDSENSKVMVVLPSVEELKQIGGSTTPFISVKGLSKGDPFNFANLYREELQSLYEKFNRFESSPKYLTHLAQLNSLTGELDLAEKHARTASNLDSDRFFVHELGAHLVDQEKDSEAWDIFKGCDIDEDIHANLRLAQLLTKKDKPLEAEKYIQKALQIDNTNYRARMFEGAINLWKKEWELAIRSFRVAVVEKDTSAVLFVNLAAAYWGLGEGAKALKSLKRAISLDPLNETAVVFLADVLFLNGSPEKCLLPLETILLYEQKSYSLWARLARAYYEVALHSSSDSKLLRKALDSLNSQVQLKKDSAVLNNIGVVYNKLRKPQMARKYFANAWALARKEGEDSDASLSNLLSVLIDLKDYKNVFEISSEVIKSNCEDEKPSNYIARIFIFHIISMEGLGCRSDAAIQAESYLAKGLSDRAVTVELLAHLVYYRTLIDPDREAIERILPIAEDVLRNKEELPAALYCRALNNFVFALLQMDKIELASSYLSGLSHWIHKDPYVTATFGLFHLKKGRSSRAQDLYREAIALVNNKTSKGRIRQRMNLELGKVEMKRGNEKLAIRYLLKARKQKLGFDYAAEDADKLLLTLPKV